MTSTQQRAELRRRISQIAKEVRGAVDGWDFKQYVLRTLFYRFISENFIDYIHGGDPDVKYAEMADDDKNIAPAKDEAVKTKGYFRHSMLSNKAFAQPTPQECATVKLLLDHPKNSHGLWLLEGA